LTSPITATGHDSDTKRLILKFYGFRAFDHQMRHFLVEEIASMIRSQLKP
jgi:hypothetical protein